MVSHYPQIARSQACRPNLCGAVWIAGVQIALGIRGPSHKTGSNTGTIGLFKRATRAYIDFGAGGASVLDPPALSARMTNTGKLGIIAPGTSIAGSNNDNLRRRFTRRSRVARSLSARSRWQTPIPYCLQHLSTPRSRLERRPWFNYIFSQLGPQLAEVPHSWRQCKLEAKGLRASYKTTERTHRIEALAISSN
jgi:hypothetical protein